MKHKPINLDPTVVEGSFRKPSLFDVEVPFSSGETVALFGGITFLFVAFSSEIL